MIGNVDNAFATIERTDPAARKTSWIMARDTADTPYVLACESESITRYAEDPYDPAREFCDAIGGDAAAIRVLVLPPCSPTTIACMHEHLPNVVRLLVFDYDTERWLAWRAAMGERLPDRVDAFILQPDADAVARGIEHELETHRIDMISGACRVYVPRRMKRLAPGLCHVLEKTTLRVHQEHCSDAVFRTLRSWHLTLNHLLNAEAIGRCVQMDLSPRFDTAVIVGAGPSLDRNVEQLKHDGGSRVVIATDASVATLLSYDITPDIIVSMDDSPLTWQFFAAHLDALTTVPLVMPMEANHTLVRHYTGPVVFVNNLQKADENVLATQADESVACGRCVGHLAFHLAERMTTGRIIMIGFDLAFESDRYHTKHAAVPYNQGKGATTEVFLPGIDGAEVRSDLGMMFYLNYFEKAIRECAIAVIDATEGGARINGATTLSLRDALVAHRPQRGAAPALRRHGDDRREVEAAIMAVSTVVTRAIRSDLPTAGTARAIIDDILVIDRRISEARRDPGRILTGHHAAPLGWLPMASPAFPLVMSCSSLLTLARFRTAWFQGPRFSSNTVLKSIFADVLDDLAEAVQILLEALRMVNGGDTGERRHMLLLTPEGAEPLWLEAATRISSGAPIVSLPAASSLTRIWATVREHGVAQIVVCNGDIVPDAWSAPDIDCIDIKTSYAPREHERNFWIPGYAVAGIDDTLTDKWRCHVPEHITCSNYIDYIRDDGNR